MNTDLEKLKEKAAEFVPDDELVQIVTDAYKLGRSEKATEILECLAREKFFPKGQE